MAQVLLALCGNRWLHFLDVRINAATSCWVSGGATAYRSVSMENNLCAGTVPATTHRLTDSRTSKRTRAGSNILPVRSKPSSVVPLPKCHLSEGRLPANERGTCTTNKVPGPCPARATVVEPTHWQAATEQDPSHAACRGHLARRCRMSPTRRRLGETGRPLPQWVLSPP